MNLSVSIRTKEKLLYSGTASSVSSENVNGPFDIIPQHANFISLIYGYLIVDLGLSTEQKFDVEKGVMYVMSDKVDVYLGI